MPDSYFPLRWESTGDQWWYASPIDWAAANGHYDLVRELLHLDTNLLIKLTSLRRIRRLETVWDDDARFFDAAKCRSFVARSLLLDCEAKGRKNTLIRAGYGGWLLYTAASAGDVKFVQELLERDPLLVFGEGEYGVTDILYAAARSKNSRVFKLLFDFAVSPRCSMGGGGAEIEEEERFGDGSLSVFRWEMVNRAVHAAARGGNLEILRELLGDCSGLLAYRDAQGSTVLHAASGRGQVEVVKDLVASFDLINSRDNQGNTSLHVAAFRGHLSVVEALLRASPSSSSSTNNAGDTFFHMAVAGFRTTGFHRLDRQMELMKQLIHGTIVNIQEIINIKNNDGRTVLHMAMIGTVHSDLVELLMTVRSVNLNTRDVDGLTPLDLLSQRPRTASSEILIKQLTFAGGISVSKDQTSGSATSSRMQGIGNSPGTSFRIPDAEIFLYAGIGAVEDDGRPSSCSSASKSELSLELSETKQSPMNSAARRLKILLGWPRRRERKNYDREDTPTPLRQRCSQASSLLNNKRALAMPSPATKKKFTAGLMQGVIQAMPHPGFPSHSPSGSFSMSSTSSPASEKQKGVYLENEGDVASCSKASSNSGPVVNVPQRSGFVNSKVMNRYLCFGAQGLAVEDSVHGRRPTQIFKRFLLSVA